MLEEQEIKELSLREWLETLLLTIIPCVNIIMLFVWGFGETEEPKKSRAKGYLLILLVRLILTIISYALLIAAIAAIVRFFSNLPLYGCIGGVL